MNKIFSPKVNSPWFIEFFIGVICACFAYFTYGNAIVLFVSTALIATVCLGLTIYNVYTIIQDIRWQKQQQNLAANVNSSGK